MSPLLLRACAVGAGLLLALSATPARAATNLLTNGGFETAGSAGTVFSDTFPDLAAWTTLSGTLTVAAGVVTAAGAPGVRDAAVVTNSGDYTAGTFQAVVTPVNAHPQLVSGVLFRTQSAAAGYECAITKGALELIRRTGGVDTLLGTAAFTVNDNTGYRVAAAASGTTLTCTAQPVAGGATATVTRTDATYGSGSIGIFSDNANGGPARQTRFSAPSMSATTASGWSGLTVASGRPGLVPDVIAPNGGTSHLQLFGGSATFGGWSQQTVTAGPGSYTLQAAVRTAAVTGSAQVVAIESPSGTTTTLATVSGTTAWTVYSASFTAQPSTTSITVRLRLTGAGRASFDDVSLTVTPYVGLALSSASVNFGSVDPLSSPWLLADAVDAVVTSNSTWQLSASGSGNFSDGAGKTFPLSRLEWRVTGGAGAFTPFSTASATLATGSSTPVGGSPTPLDLRLTVTYADPVSTLPFQTTLTYIATTP